MTRRCTGVAGVACLMMLAGCRNPPKVERSSSSEPSPSLGVLQPATVDRAAPRTYPNSIVPGGIHTVAEFQTKPDSVARAHYGRLRAVKLAPNPVDQRVFVSFRIGNVPYWTKKRLSIPAGETLVALTGSSSVHWARARCGNLLSDVPRQPTLSAAQEEPVLAAMNQPESFAPPFVLDLPEWQPASAGDFVDEKPATGTPHELAPVRANYWADNEGPAVGVWFQSGLPPFGASKPRPSEPGVLTPGSGSSEPGEPGAGGVDPGNPGSVTNPGGGPPSGPPIVQPGGPPSVTTTPEPSTWGMVLGACACLLLLRSRRRLACLFR